MDGYVVTDIDDTSQPKEDTLDLMLNKSVAKSTMNFMRLY